MAAKSVNKSVQKTKVKTPKICPEYVRLEEQYSELMYNYKILLKENDKLRREIAFGNSDKKQIPTSLNEISSRYTQTEMSTAEIVAINEIQQECSTNQISSTGDSGSANSNPSIEHIEGPCMLFPGHPFSSFSVEQLDNELTYSHSLESRKLMYYGDYPYTYGKIAHDPCPIPENSYLSKIINHVTAVCPKYEFNSVLVTKFESGKSFLPMHSDNESVIHPNSTILTISLGATRTIKFQLKDAFSSPDCSINVSHGDVYAMTCKSQSHYKHGIPKDYSKETRLSLTFRLIIPNKCNTSLNSVDQFLYDLNPIQPSPNQSAQLAPSDLVPISTVLPVTTTDISVSSETNGALNHNEIDTIYISSSMFRELNEEKLSSSEHNSAVLYFPGATASGIYRRLQDNSRLRTLNPSKIKQVFLMCGTNDVDNILGIKRLDHSSININNSSIDHNKLQRTLNEIDQLIKYLHQTFTSANIKMINILPRMSRLRNEVINEINGNLKSLSSIRPYLSYVNTEFNINLFSDTYGYRKNDFFKSVGSDNVHLSKQGVIRLGKHLKYIAHN